MSKVSEGEKDIVNADIIQQKSDGIMEEELSEMIRSKLSEYKSDGEEASVTEESEKAPPTPRKKPNPNEGHRMRMRKKFLASGFEGFAPHEIIEMLLYYTVPRADTNKTAHELINRFGSIAGVFNADVSELEKVSGVSENAAVLFKMIPQIVPVYYSEMNRNVSYNNTDKLKELFRPYFVGAGSEAFYIACFDNSLRLLKVERISSGSAAFTSLDMRKIMECIIGTGCNMAAMAHNHPGASPKPSDEDIAVTRKVCQILGSIDVVLMDHIVVGADSSYSMRDCGDLGIFD
ncbi:MAG: RadC family protein [Huintestinicola sp.]